MCAAHTAVPARAQSMSADPVAFTMTSDVGAAVKGRVLVRGVGGTSRWLRPWALVGAPIESMLTAAGDAWAEFVLVEGNGGVYVLVAPEALDRAASAVGMAGSGTVAYWMYYGAVSVNGARVRDSTPDWGARMAPGESVRVRYVAATRIVSVVWRVRAYDLAALPATADIARMRFGVALVDGYSMRVTGASAGARRKCIRCRMCFWLLWSFHQVIHAARVFACARTQRTTSCRTCDSSCAPA